MKEDEIVAEFERIGVRLWKEDGQLRFRAPHGVMTEERLRRLREHKESILDQLRRAAEPQPVVPDPANRHEPFPLSDIQAAYLLGRGDGYGYGGVACHAYVELAFTELDTPQFQAAWNALIRRHDMLRAVVAKDGYQRVLPEVDEYRIEVTDCKGAGAATVSETIETIRERHSHEVHDTEEWPLFSLRITQTDNAAIVHFSIDFLIADFVSIDILMCELATLYADGSTKLPPLEITFRDYLAAASSVRQTSRWDRDRRYWTERIDQLPSAPALPVRTPGTASAGGRFHRLETSLDDAQWSRLRAAAAGLGITPSTAVLAAYADVIGQWSARDRFLVNLTVLNRPVLHSDIARLVGDFTSVNLLEVAPQPSDTLAKRAKQLQAQLWQDLDHASYSGIEVIRELVRRRGQRAALMPVVFTSAIGLDGAGGGPEIRYGITQTPQVFLDCQVSERSGRLLVNWDVRDGVFPPGLAEDMFQSFAALLRRLSDDQSVWQEIFPVPLPAAQRERRVSANATEAPLPSHLLHEPVLHTAAAEPERAALWCEGRWMSYGELAGRAHAVAEWLILSGCQPREVVAVVMEKGWAQVVGVLGALIAGAAYLPLDTNQPPARRKAILAAADARFALTQSQLGPADTERADIQVLAVDNSGLAGTSVGMPERRVQPGDLAYVIYTSGSTGAPKGVMITHQAAANTVHDVMRRWSLSRNDRVLGLANLGFDLSVFDIFAPLAVGGGLVLPQAGRHSDPAHWAELIDGHGVTFWNSVPAQLQMLYDFAGTAHADLLSTVRIALLSGDWIPVSLARRMRAEYPHIEMVSLGGATEVSIWSIYHRIDDVPADRPSIPYGTPLANQRFHVLDEAMRERPDWVSGDLYIAGAGLAVGYLGDAEQTERAFVRHPDSGERLYRTGDLGRYLPDGEIEFLGRRDLQIKLRGHRIELTEVDTALESHPAVASATTVVHGDRPLERRLIAFVTTAPRPLTGSVGLVRPGRLADEARRAGDAVRRGVDAERYVSFARRLDRLALSTMVAALSEAGLFSPPGAVHDVREILDTARVVPKHQRLIRRWLDVLEGEGMLVRTEADRYALVVAVQPDEIEREWDGVELLAREVDFDSELLGYLRLSTQRLPELMRDEVGALQLVFPEGRVEIWEAAYKDNLLSRWVNRLIATLLTSIARDEIHAQPVRILEFGAGIGATTAGLLSDLDALDCQIDYMFTDISQFFLSDAKERFADYPWIRYGLFDLNADYRSQGFEPNSFDIIVSAHVMHYAKNAEEALARLRELLAPGGWLVFIDLTRDNYQIMTSMMFLGEQEAFLDVRRETGQTFLDREQWTALLAAAGADTTIMLPEPDDVFSSLGQHVFAASFKNDREPVRAEQLTAHLMARLPDYMIPSQIQVVDALPLTANGKVDRDCFSGWLPANATEGGTRNGERPRNDLERRLATIWAELLDVDEVGRDADFFAIGGDSLLAARLVGRVRDETAEAGGLPWDSLVREFLQQPTIANLASYLTSATGRSATSARPAEISTVVRLSRGGHGPAVVLVHGGAGNLKAYDELTRRLDTGARILGLKVIDGQRYLRCDPGAAIEDIARSHVRHLLDTGEEDVHLVGYHLGGVIAAEVARQLAERGAPAHRLSVVSSFPLPCQVDDEPLIEYLFALSADLDPVALGFPTQAEVGRALREVLRGTGEDHIRAGAFAALPARAEFAAARSTFTALARQPEEERRAWLADTFGDRHEFDTTFALFCHGLRCGARHEVGMYAGDVTLFRHTGATPLWPSLRADMTRLWSRVCLGRLTTVDIDGDHFTCLRGSGCGQVANAILAAGKVSS